jgi:uncharacterized protein (DUF1501 family)
MSHTRRDFLRATLGTSALMSLGPVARNILVGPARAAESRDRGRDTVLVVVQLSGGNDGLNTVVPYADDEYARNRTTLRLPTDKLHKIDSLLAFHPRMEAFARLYREGRLSIVQGVGYANSDRDHDRGMRIWHTADPARSGRQTGWLGRVADHRWSPAQTDVTAVFVGPIARPFALNAERAIVPCIRSTQDLIIQARASRAAAGASAGTDSELLEFLRRSTLDARATSERIRAVAESATTRPNSSKSGTADYPPFGLAGDLRTVAQLIRADVGIRIFFTELGGGGIGGFDNHANQLGNHCALLHQVAESVAAFIGDLERGGVLDRVLLMTFSEFGRTLRENGRRGTDHGAAAPMFLAGGRVTGGLVGPHPSLTDLDQGAPKFHTDFRQVYATVLDRWLGIESQTALGGRFQQLDVLKT